MPEMDEVVAKYIKARDLLRQLEAAHKKKKKVLTDFQDKCAGILREFMDTNKLENLRTAAGTCYVYTTHSASLSDPETFMQYVIANGLFDLIDRRANATAVKDYVHDHNRLPPGCNLAATQKIGVLSPTKK